MSDARRRARERAALFGMDPLAKVPHLAERLRIAPACGRCLGSGVVLIYDGREEGPGRACPSCAGTGCPLRARVELAAYCGDIAARSALPRNQIWGYTESAANFCAHLYAWADIGPAPAWVIRRALRAAQEAATNEDERRSRSWDPPPDPLLGTPFCTSCGWPVVFSSRQRGDGLCGPCFRVQTSRVALGFAEAWETCPCAAHDKALQDLLAASSTVYYWQAVLIHANGQGNLATFAIEQTAEMAGKQVVLDAIRLALVEWALS